ncbi:YebC/PmpR family DNA-binding transcriptional regulator [Candidatus Xianfuyuplasma coldseepsis]|uniref:Probable transcriptional regulatory protein G4Z02_07730 n=1 Tax=Candidatus Xianfuyuplasma coldseepsis TaxID=2782163 RepID=A0A7L7KSQ7_9MOLU|nr:YebC/PmpR family DNA-binding transcriptional regulator [Xianfuyuplasma coldseepsis]QMS85635.1 YebC/PmpR family DNA-binding transcriptional regulator [Xianfuyuplasma coldseepsis]
MGRKFEVRKAAMAKTMLHKSRLYSRYGKEIYMCAREKGSNPDSNLALKHLIDKAKKEQVPTDVINRNIKKAEQGLGEDYAPVRYEGFGPGGIGIIVDTLTDNVNRTVSEVRNCFTKTDSKLGVNGSVEHGYRHLSYVTVSGLDEETVFETLLMNDLDILEIEEEDGLVEVEANGYDEQRINQALEEAGGTIEESESGWYPHDYIELDADQSKLFHKFMDMINEVEDVQQVYHNAKPIEESD